MLPAPEHLVVEVGTGGQPRHPHVPDDVALVDPGPHADPAAESAEVAVPGDDPIGVADLHRVAQVSLGAPVDHHAVGGGHHRRARVGGVVDAPVGAPPVQDGVEAGGAEPTGDPPVLQGLQEEGPAHRLPFQVEPGSLAVVVGVEPDGVVRRPRVHQFRRQEPPGPHGAVGADLALEGEAVGVPHPDLPGEVHLPLEHLVQIVDELVPVGDGDPGEGGVPDHRGPEHRLDLARGEERVHVGGRGHGAGAPPLVVADQADGLVRVQRHVDAAEAAVFRAVPEGDLRAGLHAPGAGLLPEGQEEPVLLVPVHGPFQ